MSLGFGADELFGPILPERALRLGANAHNPVMTRKEAATLLRGAGLVALRTPVRWPPGGGARMSQLGDDPRQGRGRRAAVAARTGSRCSSHPNLLEVGALANRVRERLHGDRTYFNRNFHINATNVCVASCMFCSFARLKEGDTGAYTMTPRGGLGPAAGPGRRRRAGDRDPHRQRPARRPALRVLHGAAARAEAHQAQHPPQGLHRGGDLLLPPALRHERAGGADPAARGGPGLASRAAARRSSPPACARRSATTSAPATNGWTCTAPPTAWACARTAPCSTAPSRRSRSGSTTCCGCAPCRTRPAASRPSSRWPSTPTTTPS